MHNPWWIYNNQFLVPEVMCCSNDPRQSLVTVLHGSGWTMLKYISIQNLKWIYHGVQELWAFSLKELDRPKWCSTKPRHRFAWQWLDNVKIHKYTKFEANIPWGSRVMSIFTKRAWPVKMMLGEASSPFLHGSGWTMLKYISIQNLKWLYHGVQELWAFSLKELDRPKWCSAKPCHRFAWQWLDNVKVHKYTKFEVNIPRGSRVMSIFTNWFANFQLMLGKASSIKKDCYAWQSIDNVDMYKYGKFYQNIPCGSRVISVFANWWRTDRQTDGHTQWF